MRVEDPGLLPGAPVAPNERSRQSLLDAVMNASYDGICLVSPEGTFLEMNGAFERITGLRREDWIGRTIGEMRTSPGMARNSAALEVLRGSYPATTLVNLRDGELMLVTASPHFGESEELESIILNVRNITQLNHLKRSLEKRRGDSHAAESEVPGLRDRLAAVGLGEFVAQSSAMVEIVSTVMQIADFDLTVLIEGETGVGKGVMASLLHRLSRRSDRPFVEVNCGAIPESLIESELFGYEPGAFTGAAREGKRGYFEAANGGTIFLDEIGELPKGSQAKLLKILDDRMLVRVGGTQARHLDVRVVAATNRHLRDLVVQGQFRADLLYRLETIPIVIPPLRERPRDLKALIYTFVRTLSQELRCDREISSEAVRHLMSYPLPGNARELKNLLVRLVLSCPEREIDVAHVVAVLRRQNSGCDADEASLGTELDADGPARSMRDRIEEFERRLLAECTRRYRSTYEVAEHLGLNQSSVVRKMKKYGIRPHAFQRGG